MAMSDKDRADAEAAAVRMASAEDGRCNSGLPATPTDTPKRGFWQIHLSTALLLLMAASALLGGNVHRREFYSTQYKLTTLDGVEHLVTEFQVYRGWPWSYREGYRIVNEPEITDDPENGFRYSYNHTPSTFLNIVFAAAMLVTITFISEWLIRRLEVRKP